MMVIASAAMTNIRRIHGYQEKLREKIRKTGAVQKQMEETDGRGDYEFYCLFLEFPSAWTIQKD
jgi:hypothetical protein